MNKTRIPKIRKSLRNVMNVKHISLKIKRPESDR